MKFIKIVFFLSIFFCVSLLISLCSPQAFAIEGRHDNMNPWERRRLARTLPLRRQRLFH